MSAHDGAESGRDALVGEDTAYAARLSPRRRLFTTFAIGSCMFLASLDGTIVATAMPTVIGDLHGINLYAWVFTAYLLAEIATIPLWGRFADMFGRKPVLLTGLVIFLVGSALCGMSGTMWQLIAFRALAGVGAGCLLPVSQTLVADLYTLRQRPKVSAIFSGMFAAASILGPLLGGFLTENLSWRWVFYVNLPVGIVAFLMLWFILVEPLQERRQHRLDLLGAALLVGWTCLLLFALETGGRQYAWSSPLILGSLCASAALLVGFAFVERRASEPLIPFDLFRVPAVRAATVISISIGMAMFGVLSFIPLFMQVVIGTSATGAGRILTPLMLGSIVSSLLGSRIVLRIGFRIMAMMGFGLMIVGMSGLTLLDADSTSTGAMIPMVLIGFGMGFAFLGTLLAAQNAVGTLRMGVTTSMVNFSRQLGAAIGVAIGASVLLNSLSDKLDAAFPGRDIPAGSLMSAETARAFPPSSREIVRVAFADSLHLVFVTMAVIAVIGGLTTLLMPKGAHHPDVDEPFGPESMLPDGETIVFTNPLDEEPAGAPVGAGPADPARGGSIGQHARRAP